MILLAKRSIAVILRMSPRPCIAMIFNHRSFLPKNRFSNSLPPLEYESDSLRFIYEAHLKEFEAIRNEINLRLQFEENTINYLIVLVAALLSGSQLFGSQAASLIETLNKYPSSYLMLSLVSLLFPLTILQHNLYVVSLGEYIRFVLSPKLNAIAKDLASHSAATKEYLEWESNQFSSWLSGTHKWDEFRPAAQYNSRTASLLFFLLTAFRYMFASLPFIISLLLYFAANDESKSTNGTDWVDGMLALVLGLFIIATILGIAYCAFRYLIANKPPGVRKR